MNTESRKCRCGYGINDNMIIAKTRYNKADYIWLSLGFSVKPKQVIFQCQVCNDIILVTTDDETIEKYRYNSDVTK